VTLARDAATIMLVRDAPAGSAAGVEVCMLRRNLAAEFVAGAYVFPGGSVDPADARPEMATVCRGRTDADASAVLGVPSGGLALWVAALRECFEEAGVLLASPADAPDGELVDFGDVEVAARFGAHRAALNGSEANLLEICRQENLVLAADTVHYVSHWITPAGLPKRFDTRFFVAPAPSGQVAHHDSGETIADIWIRPADALDRHRAGEIQLMPPTIDNLENLGRWRTTEEVVAWARSVEDVPTVLPIVRSDGGRVVVYRPEDPGYQELLAEEEAAGRAPAGAG
jgi:8-oxo-dGTP pyrophosphatase MutT (NUDIX family)